MPSKGSWLRVSLVIKKEEVMPLVEEKELYWG